MNSQRQKYPSLRKLLKTTDRRNFICASHSCNKKLLEFVAQQSSKGRSYMRRALFVLWAAVIVTLIAAPASAQFSYIGLAGSAPGSLNFANAGGGTQAGLSSGFTMTTSNIGGNAYGYGSFVGDNSTYSFSNTTLASTGAPTCGPAGCTWAVTTTGSPLVFNFGPGGSLLTGTVTLVDLTQTTGGNGVFNDALLVNLTVTGGSLAGSFGSDGILQLIVNFKSGMNLQDLGDLTGCGGKACGTTVAGNIGGGSVTPLPEPNSLALLGGGLLTLGGLARRKLLTR